MATETERPPSRVDGKANPAYAVWRREQKEKALAALSAITCTIGPSEKINFTASETLTLQAVKLARNDKFVICAHDGKCVGVRIRRGMAKRLLKKTIRVEARADGTFHHLP